MEIPLEFDNTKTVKKRKGSKFTYALRTKDDDPIKVRLTLEAEDEEVLKEIIKETLDKPVGMVLRNL